MKRLMYKIKMRGNNYYFILNYRNNRYSESLKTNNLEIASELARTKWDSIQKNDLETLRKTRVKSNYSTIGEIISTYMDLVMVHNRPLPYTARINAAALRRILRRVFEKDTVDDIRSNELKGKVIIDFLRLMINNDAQKKDRNSQRRTAASTVAKARSVFSKAKMKEYRMAGLKLPNIDDFMEIHVERPEVQWAPPAENDIKTLIQASEELKRTPLRAVWIMAYGSALRAKEMYFARWTWIEERDGCHWFKIIKRPEENFEPKGVSGWSPIPENLYKELMSMRRLGDPFILAGENITARHDLVEREFPNWVRSILPGWDRGHMAHEMRALRINDWAMEYGLSIAKSWARHENCVVTRRHYVEGYMPVPDERKIIQMPAMNQ